MARGVQSLQLCYSAARPGFNDVEVNFHFLVNRALSCEGFELWGRVTDGLSSVLCSPVLLAGLLPSGISEGEAEGGAYTRPPSLSCPHVLLCSAASSPSFSYLRLLLALLLRDRSWWA